MKNDASRICTIEAPCKINLHLQIGQKRPDGYHDLESLFASLAFGDTLRFESGAKNGAPRTEGRHLFCHLLMEWEGSSEDIPREQVPMEKNLVFRAVSLFRERTGFDSPLEILVKKRIPGGAGLGGGSSDAASTLLALNFLAGEPLSDGELGEMAAILGSDVPFFLKGGAAYVCGRGEIVESAEIPQNLWVVLSKPPFSSSTASAYRLLDEAREAAAAEEKYWAKALSKESIVRALGTDPETWPYANDFLPVFLASPLARETGDPINAGIYRDIIGTLRETGASFAGLSGSGSSCFGIFRSEKQAEKSEKELSKRGNFTKLTFFLARRPIPVLE